MHDFCGALSPGLDDLDELASIVSGMLARRGHAPDPLHTRVHGSGVVSSVSKSGSVAERDGLLAVLVGRPRFADEVAEGDSAASGLLTLWRTHGRELPKRLSGSFALAIIDSSAQEVFLAIDRIGIQTLAFGVADGGLVFANRADLVAAHPGVGADLDPQAIFNYLYFSVVPAPGTIFRGVEKLLPAQWAHFRKGAVERGFYWSLHYRDRPRTDFEAQSAHLKDLLRESVGRAQGSEKVAAFLSGGIDSSTVAGVLAEAQGKSARTYSIGFDAEGFDEMEYVRIAARHFGLSSREYYLTPDDVLATIPVIAQQYDEPFANESAVSAYHCAKLAAEDGYGVMLGGDGGDEIFGGNERYAKQKVFEVYGAIPPWIRRSLIEPVAGLPGMDRLMPTRKLASYVRQARIPLPDRMESYNFVYRQPLDDMLTADFLEQIDPAQPGVLLRDPYGRADGTHFINRMLHLDLKFTLADNDLRKVSAMCEAAGVEVRYPLLDDAMVEFSGEIPPDWKVKGRYLRWFFKTAMRGYLPDAIIDKSKHGFGLPFGIWLRDHTGLSERVQDRLSDFSRRGWLRPDYIAQVQTDHRAQHATYFGKMLWMMLILEEWLAVQAYT